MSRQDGRCPFCGEFLDPSSPTCPSCRRNIFQSQIDGSIRDGKTQPRTPSITLTPRNLVIGGIVLLLIVAVPIITVLSLSKTGSNQTIVKTVIVHDQSTELSTQPTPAQPTPTLSPPLTSGTILCQADWSSGMNGWTGTPDWKTLNGMLLNDGTNYGTQDPPTLLAPCDLNSVPNYKVEVKIQMQSQSTGHFYGYPGFGLYVRYRPDSNSGYMVGDSGDPLSTLSITPASDIGSSIENIDFVPGTAMRTYTITVKDNHIEVFIDGGFVTDVTDNKSLAGGSVGFWDKGVELTISSFKVISL